LEIEKKVKQNREKRSGERSLNAVQKKNVRYHRIDKTPTGELKVGNGISNRGWFLKGAKAQLYCPWGRTGMRARKVTLTMLGRGGGRRF